MTQIPQYSRIKIKRLTGAGEVPTIPITDDHTGPGWTYTDLYVGELCMNVTDERLFMRTVSGIKEISYSGQTSTFVGLSDCPATYNGKAGYGIQVNSGETGLEFVAWPDTGLTNSVDHLEWAWTSGTSIATPASSATTIFFDETGELCLKYEDGSVAPFINSGLYVDLLNAQDISGAKRFVDYLDCLSGLTVGGDLTVTGNIYGVSAAGAESNIQYNEGGSFGGSAAFMYHPTQSAVTIGDRLGGTIGSKTLTVGKANLVSANYSGSFGDKNSVQAENSFATGSNHIINKQNSAAIGGDKHNIVHENVVILGGTSINSSANDTVYMPRMEITESTTQIIMKDVVTGVRNSVVLSGGTFVITPI